VNGAKTKTSTVRNIAMIAAHPSGLTLDPGQAEILQSKIRSRPKEMDKTVSIRPRQFPNPNWRQAKLLPR